MEFKNDFSVTKLFAEKRINVFVDKNLVIEVNAFSARHLIEDSEWGASYNLMILDKVRWQKLLKIDLENSFDYITTMIFQLGCYREYNDIATILRNNIEKVFENTVIDFQAKEIKINDITITSEIWDYLVYVLKLIHGEKVNQPLTFTSPEAKAFWEKQQALEQKIKETKEKNNKDDKEALMKGLLTIVFAFPSFTIDYLLDQTMAQIHWLYEQAAKAVSYNVNEKVFAAGNMKKGKNLDFFIK